MPERDYDETTRERFEDSVRKVADEIVEMLVSKNRQYGNAALNPLRIFSKGLPTSAMIAVRIDDKLSRVQLGPPDMETEDVEKDLIGYFILRRIEREGMMENPPILERLPNIVASGGGGMPDSVTR